MSLHLPVFKNSSQHREGSIIMPPDFAESFPFGAARGAGDGERESGLFLHCSHSCLDMYSCRNLQDPESNLQLGPPSKCALLKKKHFSVDLPFGTFEPFPFAFEDVFGA